MSGSVSVRAWALSLLLLMATPERLEAAPADYAYPSDSTLAFEVQRLPTGETLESRFGDDWVAVARFNRVDRRHVRAGTRLRVPTSLAAARCFAPLPDTLPHASTYRRYVWVDLAEQFLGAYEYGRRVWCAPIASGRPDNPTPAGRYFITRAHRDHRSDRYTLEHSKRPYPMDWALQFFTDAQGVRYWIHGRDLPGAPTSHGCIGLSDEAMQARCYGEPRTPQLADARWLYGWVVAPAADTLHARVLAPGIPLEVVGVAPTAERTASADRRRLPR